MYEQHCLMYFPQDDLLIVKQFHYSQDYSMWSSNYILKQYTYWHPSKCNSSTLFFLWWRSYYTKGDLYISSHHLQIILHIVMICSGYHCFRVKSRTILYSGKKELNKQQLFRTYSSRALFYSARNSLKTISKLELIYGWAIVALR